MVERAVKLYLFETEAAWIEALQATFAPYADKVVIINKYVSDHDDESSTTLDTALGGQKVDFIKVDIEGAERELLAGAKDTLSRQPLRVVLCSYHRQDDMQVLQEMLQGSGFQTEFSDGYMIFTWDKELAAPYLRRGLIRAEK